MNKKTLFLITILFSSFSIQAVEPAVSSSEKTPLKVMLKWNHQFQFAGFYAAQKKGFYQDNNLLVELQKWNRQNAVETVLSGEVDIAIDSSLLIADYIKRKPIQLLLASFQYSPLILISHTPITKLSTLKNKKIAYLHSFEILSILNKSGKSIDKFNLIPLTDTSLQEFIEHKTDVYAGYETDLPFYLQTKRIPHFIIDPKTYGLSPYDDIVFTSKEFAQRQPEELEKFKLATIQGWQYALENPEEIVDYIIQNYETEKTKEEMLDEASKTAKYIKTHDTPIGDLSLSKLKCIADQMQGLALFSKQELQETNFDELIFSRKQLTLTALEKKYLAENPVIKIGNHSDRAPFEYINKDGLYTGITADYMNIIEHKLGVKFDFIQNVPWYKVIKMAKDKSVKMLPAAHKNQQKSQYLNFTKPYLSFPNVLLAKDNKHYINNLNVLEGKTLAVIKQYTFQNYLQKNYPKINLLIVENTKQGMESVLKGQSFAYINSLPTISYYLKKYGFDGLKIIGQTDLRLELSIAVQKDNPVLLTIMQKSLDSITEAEKTVIYNKWFGLRIVSEIDNQKLLTVIAWFLLLLSILSAFLIYLYLAKKKQKKYIRQINELSCATVSDTQQNLLWVSGCFCKLVGLSKKQLIGKNEWKIYAASSQIENRKELKRTALNLSIWKGELKGYHNNGDVFWTRETRVPERHGSKTRIVTTRQIITEHKQLEALSIIDPLTELYNRRHFNDIFPQEIKRQKRSNKFLAVAYLDIDHFKMVNDTYGHQVGDEVLQKISKVLQMYFIRAEDFVFRIGGEEFFIIANFDKKVDFYNYLEKIRKQIQALKIKNIHTDLGVVTISIGADFIDLQKMDSVDDIYNQVDKALYYAKNTGRNKTHFSEATKQLNIPLS